MAWSFLKNTYLLPVRSKTNLEFLRHGHHLRGNPPTTSRNIKQRLAELNYKDPTLHYRINIGLPVPVVPRNHILKERLVTIKAQRYNSELERLSRNNELRVDLEKVNAEWLKSSHFYTTKLIADHYGVFEHLFGDAYFNPIIPLSIQYESDDILHPVYFGNVIKPLDAVATPQVTYPSDDKTFWTLIMTNPDGHFTQQDKEYVHWMVGNIPGNNLSKGETIFEYLQPFPPKGTGYHRHVFVLYQQNGKLDYSALRKEGKCLNLDERTFNTLAFYRERQDHLTPGGLAFFQSDWDKSLSKFFHETLDMKEPIFEYDFPKPYIRPQEWFPLKQPFNLYMDKYRDPKQINKEFLVRKLKNVHPFQPAPAPLPFPNAVYFEKYYPSWLKLEIRKSRLKWGRINDIE